MNQPRRIFAVILFSGTLLLTGCGILDYLAVPVMTAGHRFYPMIALVDGQNVAFTLPDEDLADKNIKFMLYSIDVSTTDACDKSCVVWEVVRPIDSNIDLVEENFVTLPIKYGVTLPNTQTRVHEALRKGQYSASAGFKVIKDGKIIDSKQVVVGFTIE
jgi:hypothetical protein